MCTGILSLFQDIQVQNITSATCLILRGPSAGFTQTPSARLYQITALPYSRRATALLINRASGKGLIVDSTSANGPLLGNPFLTSTGWCEKYFFIFFSLFATKKRRESPFLF